jgi:hypothetical protein
VKNYLYNVPTMKIGDSSVHVNNMEAKLKWSVWNSVVISHKLMRITNAIFFVSSPDIYRGEISPL